MSRPDEGLIHQWLDGECTPEESARLEHLVATDPEWAAAVAEARGLIAASSRIVQSLDAVPRAMPAGSLAQPRLATQPAERARTPQRFAAKPWMRIAAAVVLVAGTAYVLRERTTEPFVPVATVDLPAPAAPPAMSREEMSRVEPPSTVPPLGPVQTADRAVAASAGGASENTPTPVLSPEVEARNARQESPPAPSPSAQVIVPPAAQPAAGASVGASAGVGSRAEADQRARVSEDTRARAANREVQRRASLSAEAPRGATARAANAPAASPALPDAMVALEGCWRVSAPPELVGVLIAPEIRRQRGDTLVLVTTQGDVVVVRTGDSLQGALMARAEPCKE